MDRRALGSLIFGLTLGGVAVLWITLLVCGASPTASTMAMLVVVVAVGLVVLVFSNRRPSPRTTRGNLRRSSPSAEDEPESVEG